MTIVMMRTMNPVAMPEASTLHRPPSQARKPKKSLKPVVIPPKKASQGDDKKSQVDTAKNANSDKGRNKSKVEPSTSSAPTIAPKPMPTPSPTSAPTTAPTPTPTSSPKPTRALNDPRYKNE